MNKTTIKYLIASSVYAIVMIIFNVFINNKTYNTFEYIVDFITYAIAFAALLLFVQLFMAKPRKK